VKFTSKVGLCLSIGSLFAGGTYVLPCFFAVVIDGHGKFIQEMLPLMSEMRGVCGTWVILFWQDE